MGGLFEKEGNAGWHIYFLTSLVFLGLDIGTKCIDKYGNGRNWSEFYAYLINHGITDRTVLAEYAYDSNRQQTSGKSYL